MDGLKDEEFLLIFYAVLPFLLLVRTALYVLYIHLVRNSYRRMRTSCLLFIPFFSNFRFLFDLNPSVNHFFNNSFRSYLAGTFKS